MANLTDFGVDTRPKLVKGSALELGYRQVGNLCRRESDEKICYASVRNAEDHRYHGEDPWYDLPFEGDAYGLSIELFERLHAAGVGPVYIIEGDTDTVYHFSHRQFVDGHPINFEDGASGRGYEKDSQMVVPVAEAVEKWENHAADLWARQAAFR